MGNLKDLAHDLRGGVGKAIKDIDIDDNKLKASLSFTHDPAETFNPKILNDHVVHGRQG